ncbi:MAG: 50S ribosomal protein L31e [Candidatus Bathycorpusculaceae bacterium]
MEENAGEEQLKTGEEQEKTVEAAEEEETEIEEAVAEEEEKAEEIVETEEEEMPAAIEEEVKPPPPEEKEEEEIAEERIYTIPLSRAWIMPPNKRAPRAMRIIRNFIVKHMKLGARREGEEEEEPKRLIISNEVNEKVWGRGIEKPPRKIRIRAAKDKEGNVTVYLAEGD